jgi:site-specific recombinase XerD
MLLPIKPICPFEKTRQNGTSVIYLQYCQNSDRKTLLNTEIAIPPKFWNRKLNRVMDDLPPEYGTAKSINLEIHRLYRMAEDIIKFAIRLNNLDPVHFVKQTFSPDFDINLLGIGKPRIEVKIESKKTEKINLDFFFQFDQYLKSKESAVSHGTMDVLRNLKSILEKFQDHRNRKIRFDQIDLSFYEEYVHYLTYDHIQFRKIESIRGLKVNSIGKNIKQLVIFLKNRQAKKIIPVLDLSGFKIHEEDSDAIYLTSVEITAVSKLDLNNHPHLKMHRDLFVLGCLTGLRFSDFSKLRAEDLRDNMLYKKQGKTKHWVVIPLRSEASEIFERLFSQNVPKTSNPEFNNHIKEIGRLADLCQSIKHSCMRGNMEVFETKPKYGWITSHTCRRSFCTNEFLAGTPVELIMKISGHKSLKDFYRYIKIAPEQAGQQIREIWRERGEMAMR